MDKSDLKALLSELLEEVLEEKLEKIQTKSDRKEEKKTKYRRRKKQEQEQKKAAKNEKDLDLHALGLTAAERKELEQASKADKANNVHLKKDKLTQRRPSGKIEVRCRSCGKVEKVSPLFVLKDEDGYRYKCNKCSCSAG